MNCKYCPSILWLLCTLNFRPSEIRRIRLGIHIFGMFIYEPSTMYVDGTYVEKDWSVDVDELSYIDIKNMLEKMGYKKYKCIWY